MRARLEIARAELALRAFEPAEVPDHALDAARLLYEAGGVALGTKDDAGAEVLLRRAGELVSDRVDEDPAELDLFDHLGALPSAIH